MRSSPHGIGELTIRLTNELTENINLQQTFKQTVNEIGFEDTTEWDLWSDATDPDLSVITQTDADYRAKFSNPEVGDNFVFYSPNFFADSQDTGYVFVSTDILGDFDFTINLGGDEYHNDTSVFDTFNPSEIEPYVYVEGEVLDDSSRFDVIFNKPVYYSVVSENPLGQ